MPDFKCPQCRKLFRTQSGLDWHVLHQHKAKESQQWAKDQNKKIQDEVILARQEAERQKQLASRADERFAQAEATNQELRDQLDKLFAQTNDAIPKLQDENRKLMLRLAMMSQSKRG